MGLTDEERAQLEALTARANEPDNDDDFEIEIGDGEGNWAKVPYHKGKAWLRRFGIDLPETPESNETETPKKTPGKAPTGEAGSHAQRYFGATKRAT